MQRELFNNILGSSLYVYMFQLQPFEGGHDADLAHGENEFDTPDLEWQKSCMNCWDSDRIWG